MDHQTGSTLSTCNMDDLTEVWFSVREPKKLSKEEWIGIVGNTKELGMWDLQKSVVLLKCNSIWEQKVKLQSVHIKYRYFIGRFVSSEKYKVVNLWESHLKEHCRTVVVTGGAEMKLECDDFGVISEIKKIDRGWLVHQNEIRFGISSPIGHPFIDLNDNASLDISQLSFSVKAYPEPLYSTFYCVSPFKFQEVPDASQSLVKVPTSENNHITYVVETDDYKNTYFIIEIAETCSGKVVGSSLFTTQVLTKSKGVLCSTLLNNRSKPIGMLRIPWLVIKPLNIVMLMDSCFTQHWKTKPTAYIGHRGSGNSFTSERLADVRENSISSFNKAANNGAYCVEFDVHLTKDLIPIVYHDLTVCVAVEQKDKSNQLLEVPLCHMTFKEAKSAKLFHKSRMNSTRLLAFSEDMIAHNQPIPTLKEIFQDVSAKCGFNIEMKWPTLDINYAYESGLENYIDANEFVDRILQCVFTNAGDRRIIFSSFDVDICIMLRRKQNRYPVLFLTNGDTMHYTPMLDLRERTNAMAIGTSSAEGFLGLDTLDRDIYKTPEIVQKTHDAGLLLACYGDDVGDNLKTMQELKVDIAILDRIYETRNAS